MPLPQFDLLFSRRDSHSGLSSVVDQQQQIERDATDLVLRADEVDVGPGQTQITLSAKVKQSKICFNPLWTEFFFSLFFGT